MSKCKVEVFVWNETSMKVAVRPEFSIHGLSERVPITASAAITRGVKTELHNNNSEAHPVDGFNHRMAEVYERKMYFISSFP